MKGRIFFYAFIVLIVVGVGITTAGDGLKPQYQKSEKEFYLTEAEVAWLRPGLKLTIQRVEIEPPNVHVTFRIADDQDQPLDRAGIETPGTVSTSWQLALIKAGDSQYTAYTIRTRTNQVTREPVIQATSDSGGSYTSLGNGVYRYTFGTKLPSDFEADSTHTVGVFASRDVRALAQQLGLPQLAKIGLYIANATLDFVPSGKAVTQVRDVVRTEACNQCHDPLAMHTLGARRSTQLCVLCHQPQTTDDVSGNPVDFKIMVHKIHRGRDLPSVRAGTPYFIEDEDFSEIGWPQDVRNCTTCHQRGTQSDNWKNNPSRAACGSCHDDVNFATGAKHPGGVQVDDSKCSTCHPADTGLEFDLSVAGVHTIPAFSKQLKGVNLKILEITNTKPGDKPTVSFTATNNDGSPIRLSDFNSFSLRLAGPTGDYTWNVQEDGRSARATSTGYTYTFTANASAIPRNATGTYAVGMEGRRLVKIPGPLLGQEFETEEGAVNPILYFSVDGSKVEPRRTVVDIKNCDTCHKKLSMHGGTRNENPNYCVMCHNPATVDNPTGSRAGGFKVPEGTVPTSINFRFMIHRWHTGSDLTRNFTVYRSRGVFSPNEEVHFPGDRRNCAKCHVNNSHQLPLPATLANTLAPREFFSPLGPAASACLGCHDTQYTAAHALSMTTSIGEACAACHGEGKDFAVSKVHAR